MANPALRAKLSPQEYLDFERSSEQRHEYADGEIFAMAGGTLEHSAVAANLLGELRNALLGRGCRMLTSDMRIKTANGRYVYPDGAVLCERPEFEDDKRDTLLNPAVIVEVLSDSSEAYDRGEKFAQYRTLPSLRDYVLASQKEPRLEVFTRQSDGSWVLRIYGPGERAALTSIGVEITMDRTYADVFEQSAAGA